MNPRVRKRLLRTYYTALGYGGKRVDEEQARNIVRRIGLDATNDHGNTPLTVAVWFYADEWFESCDPPRGFLFWYEAWLMEELGLDCVSLGELLASERRWRAQRHARMYEPPLSEMGDEDLLF